MASIDRISGLPAEILDHILGFLPIEEAAKTIVLSTMWRDVWFGLSQINIDSHFFRDIDRKNRFSNINVRKSVGVNVINNILLQHSGGIQKFVLDYINSGIYTLLFQQSADIDRWVHLVTQKGVQEMDFGLFHKNACYRVPTCIFSCSTLKILNLSHVHVEPVNVPCELPKVTSICFVYVHFVPKNHLGGAVDTPVLENLLFSHCENMSYFKITAPKLSSLRIESCSRDSRQHYVSFNLRPVCTLDLDGGSLQCFVKLLNRVGFPVQQLALKVECLKISNFSFRHDVMTSAFVPLLRACPRLCELDISFGVFMFGGVSEAACADVMLKLLAKLCSLSRTHTMQFRVLKLSSFGGYESEILLIKGIADCFPTLEKVVITPCSLFLRHPEFETMQKNLHFLGLPTKAEIVFVNR